MLQWCTADAERIGVFQHGRKHSRKCACPRSVQAQNTTSVTREGCCQKNVTGWQPRMCTVEVPLKALWPRAGLRSEVCSPTTRPFTSLRNFSGTQQCTRRAIRRRAASDKQAVDQVGTGSPVPPAPRPEQRWDACKIFSQSDTSSGGEHRGASSALCAGRTVMIQRSPCWPSRCTAAPISCSI